MKKEKVFYVCPFMIIRNGRLSVLVNEGNLVLSFLIVDPFPILSNEIVIIMPICHFQYRQ